MGLVLATFISSGPPKFFFTFIVLLIAASWRYNKQEYEARDTIVDVSIASELYFHPSNLLLASYHASGIDAKVGSMDSPLMLLAAWEAHHIDASRAVML